MTHRFGEYRLQAILGRGGSGSVVYLARRGRMGPQVALKVPGPVAQHSNAQTILREIALHSQLNHPRIIRVLESGMVEGLIYLALEYVPGGTLHDLLAGGVRLRLGQVVTLVSQLAEALGYAHNVLLQHQGVVLQGMLHRDIKPQNIYLDGSGGAKLGDFGIAKPVTSGYTVTMGGFPGTPPYMSPEQFVSQDDKGNKTQLTPASDVWQLAVVACEVLTGMRPFGPYSASEDTIVVVNRILRESPVNPCRSNPEIPAQLGDLLMSALDKDPSKRPDLEEFARRFRQAAAVPPEPLPAAAPSEIVRARPLTDTVLGASQGGGRRHVAAKLMVVSLILVFVVFLSIAGTLIWRGAGRGTVGSGGGFAGDPATWPGGSIGAGAKGSADNGTLAAVGAKDRPVTIPKSNEAPKQDSPDRFLKAAEIAEKAGRWQEAIDCYDNALAISPGTNIQRAREQVAKRRHDYDEALADARKAEETGRWSDAEGLYRKASGLCATKESEEGRDFCRRKMDEARQKVDGYRNEVNAARGAEARGKWQEAIDAWTRVQGLDPAVDVSADLARAREGKKKCDYREHVAAAEKALAEKDYGKALEETEKAHALYPDGKEVVGLAEKANPTLTVKAELNGKEYAGALISFNDKLDEHRTPQQFSFARGTTFKVSVTISPSAGKFYTVVTQTVESIQAGPHDFLASLCEIRAPAGFVPKAGTVPFPGTSWARDIERSGLELSYIPEGAFKMGSAEGDVSRQLDEGPQHAVRLTRPFYMGKTEVTRKQFGVFSDDAKYKTEAESTGISYAHHVYWGTGFFLIYVPPRWEGHSWAPLPGVSWRSPQWHPVGLRVPPFEQTDDHPVVCVTWKDASEFCSWLSKASGSVARLPTEAEWEYACRAGSTAIYSWGENAGDGQVYCNGAGEEAIDPQSHVNIFLASLFNWKDGSLYTAPVGQRKPNAWGLYDMLGNVREWCSDWYGNYERTDKECQDPAGPAASTGIHVVRGGSWYDGPAGCRCGARNMMFSAPTPLPRPAALAGVSCNDTGFRVVVEAK